LNIRSIESCDIEAILAIQSVCPEIAQWTISDYARVAQGEMAGWVCQGEPDILGFLVARPSGSDIEILNLAVRRDTRRLGIGASLVREAFEWGRAEHAERAIIEVRASNVAALAFYERFGFRVAGRRPRYYAAPVEDALLLVAHLDKIESSASSAPNRP
jgi:[ribosomal protein S18]-alanine N-acetyltransferase